ncbi:MAG: serine protease [Patescibacteria group bacterium]|nr:S1C family serine protease [Patescibacteria group bacterium]MDE1946178.1 serine protease [Patescibacteria group bacterium]
MENLTKHQIVLLTLLVSFITSIATGIVTVALMNQAPVGISQTINRVVERTIETVVSTSTSPSSQQTVKETVVVSEDDQVVSAVSKNTGSVVRIYARGVDPNTGQATADFAGLGAVISADGTIAADAGAIPAGGKYFVKDEHGDAFDATIVSTAAPVALLRIASSTANLPAASVASADVQLGQAVVYIGGESKDNVATGIVSSLNMKDVAQTSTSTPAAKILSSIETNVPASDLVAGGLLFNLSGDLVGIKAAYAAGDNLFAPANAIYSVLSSAATSTQQ